MPRSKIMRRLLMPDDKSVDEAIRKVLRVCILKFRMSTMDAWSHIKRYGRYAIVAYGHSLTARYGRI